jgi:hypothetical protein
MKKLFKTKEQRNARLEKLAEKKDQIIESILMDHSEFIGTIFLDNIVLSIEEIIYNN